MTRLPKPAPAGVHPQSAAPPHRRAATVLPAVAALAILLGVAVAWLAGRDPAAPHAAPRSPTDAVGDEAVAYPLPRAVPRAPGAAAPAGTLAAPPALAATPLTGPRHQPALVARVAEEASRSLEAAREELVHRCVPQDRRGDPAARFTFNVTFDASGREIARGINEDRRFRSPEVARCLRSLPMGSIRVSPPGATVGVRVAMSIP